MKSSRPMKGKGHALYSLKSQTSEKYLMQRMYKTRNQKRTKAPAPQKQSHWTSRFRKKGKKKKKEAQIQLRAVESMRGLSVANVAHVPSGKMGGKPRPQVARSPLLPRREEEEEEEKRAEDKTEESAEEAIIGRTKTFAGPPVPCWTMQFRRGFNSTFGCAQVTTGGDQLCEKCLPPFQEWFASENKVYSEKPQLTCYFKGLGCKNRLKKFVFGEEAPLPVPLPTKHAKSKKVAKKSSKGDASSLKTKTAMHALMFDMAHEEQLLIAQVESSGRKSMPRNMPRSQPSNCRVCRERIRKGETYYACPEHEKVTAVCSKSLCRWIGAQEEICSVAIHDFDLFAKRFGGKPIPWFKLNDMLFLPVIHQLAKKDNIRALKGLLRMYPQVDVTQPDPDRAVAITLANHESAQVLLNHQFDLSTRKKVHQLSNKVDIERGMASTLQHYFKKHCESGEVNVPYEDVMKLFDLSLRDMIKDRKAFPQSMLMMVIDHIKTKEALVESDFWKSVLAKELREILDIDNVSTDKVGWKFFKSTFMESGIWLEALREEKKSDERDISILYDPKNETIQRLNQRMRRLIRDKLSAKAEEESGTQGTPRAPLAPDVPPPMPGDTSADLTRSPSEPCVKAPSDIQKEKEAEDAKDDEQKVKEHMEKNPILHGLLIEMIDAELDKQKNILRQDMTALIEFDEENWQKVCAFRVPSKFSKYRQDAVASSVVMASFSAQELDRIDMTTHSAHVNVKDIFDKTTVLSSLLIQSHALNALLQRDMETLFGDNEKALVRFGPVKGVDRCAAKAELEYRGTPFPTTCQIIDLIRGSVTFETLEDYVKGLQAFVDFVNEKKLSKRRKDSRGIVDIMRCKNGFSKFSESDLIPESYRDIKLNIVVADDNYKIVGEVQFLLLPMLVNKKQNHELYEIKRTKDLYVSLHATMPSLNDRLVASLRNPSQLASLAVHNCFQLQSRNFNNQQLFAEKRTLLMEACTNTEDVRCANIIMSDMSRFHPVDWMRCDQFGQYLLQYLAKANLLGDVFDAMPPEAINQQITRLPAIYQSESIFEKGAIRKLSFDFDGFRVLLEKMEGNGTPLKMDWQDKDFASILFLLLVFSHAPLESFQYWLGVFGEGVDPDFVAHDDTGNGIAHFIAEMASDTDDSWVDIAPLMSKRLTRDHWFLKRNNQGLTAAEHLQTLGYTPEDVEDAMVVAADDEDDDWEPDDVY